MRGFCIDCPGRSPYSEENPPEAYPLKSTMMNVPLSLNHLLERAGTLFPSTEIVSRQTDKSLARHSFGA